RTRVEGIAAVEVQIKRGGSGNELTRFRYDVVLAMGGAVERERISEELTWAQGGSLEALHEVLRERRPAGLVVRGGPNARVAKALAAVKWLREGDTGAATVGAWREHLASTAPGGVEPEAIWELAEAAGYEARLSWAEAGAEREFDALLRPRGGGAV